MVVLGGVEVEVPEDHRSVDGIVLDGQRHHAIGDIDDELLVMARIQSA